ncbi:MAG: hypothetical protein IJU76_13920 [Desulfovibrionaceae bacterium]|nr:hypothetical protein [Desulfovibrionaceae bacterium]
MNYLFKNYNKIFKYFDDWVVITATEDKKNIKNIYLRPKSPIHQETIEWVLEKDRDVA